MRSGGQAVLLARGTRTIGMCSFDARSLGIQSGRPIERVGNHPSCTQNRGGDEA